MPLEICWAVLLNLKTRQQHLEAFAVFVWLNTLMAQPTTVFISGEMEQILCSLGDFFIGSADSNQFFSIEICNNPEMSKCSY